MIQFFIRKFGVRCDVKWMLKSDKDEFLSAVDNDNNHSKIVLSEHVFDTIQSLYKVMGRHAHLSIMTDFSTTFMLNEQNSPTTA